jgi:hypothetical protein
LSVKGYDTLGSAILIKYIDTGPERLIILNSGQKMDKNGDTTKCLSSLSFSNIVQYWNNPKLLSFKLKSRLGLRHEKIAEPR